MTWLGCASGNGPTTKAPSFAAGNREAWVSALVPSDDDDEEEKDDEVGKRGDSTPATVVGEERRAYRSGDGDPQSQQPFFFFSGAFSRWNDCLWMSSCSASNRAMCVTASATLLPDLALHS